MLNSKLTWSFLLGLCLVFSFAPPVSAEPGAGTVSEPELRAATVIGVIRYTQWEEGIKDQVKLCLVGEAESFQHIEALHGTAIFPKTTLHVEKISVANQAKLNSCQVVVLGRISSAKIDARHMTQPCLIICNRCDGSLKHDSVTLRKKDGRIIFDVNLRRAKASRVSFRAAMLEIAARVEGYDG